MRHILLTALLLPFACLADSSNSSPIEPALLDTHKAAMSAILLNRKCPTLGTDEARQLQTDFEVIHETVRLGTPHSEMLNVVHSLLYEKAQLEQHIGCSDADKRRIRDGYRRAHEAAESTMH